MNATTLREQFTAARSAGKRARDAARHIGISEGEAVAAHVGDTVMGLRRCHCVGRG